MNSKKEISTEDKMAYKFFESLENLYNSINTTIKRTLEAIEDINTEPFNGRITKIDTDIPNVGITLNNKLVEIYQQFKEKNIKVFVSYNKEEKAVNMSILPSIAFMHLVNSTSQIAYYELEGFFNRYEEISDQKNSNMTKITKSKFSIIRKISKKIWETRANIDSKVIYELYFSEEEVEELRDYIENYKEFNTTLMNYNLKEDIADSILYFFELNGCTKEQINDLMKNGIEEDLVKLGLQNQIKYIRERVKEEFQEEDLKSWELTEEAKRHIQEETAKIAMESLKATKQEINAEQVK